jgi:hypothetical protein
MMGGVFGRLVTATVVVAVLCTLIIDGGWMIWVPVLPALATAAKIRNWLG